MRRLALAVLFLGLAGCAAGPTPDLRPSLPERVSRATTPLLFAEVRSLRAAAVLEPSGTNADVITWESIDGIALSLRRGMLIGTRGLGRDLMAADVSGTLAALRGGPSQDFERIHSYLDGEGRTTFRAFRCTLSGGAGETITVAARAYATQVYEETCYSSTETLSNRYWVGGDGVVRRSVQWIGPGLDYATIEQLTP